MMTQRNCGRLLFAAWLCSLSLLSTSAAAQQELRWKFKEGQRDEVTLVQNSLIDMKVGGQNVRMKTTQTTTMLRAVQSVDEAGNAKVTQKVQRVQVKSQPLGADGEAPAAAQGGFSYDSQSKEAPTGIAAVIAPIFQALTSAEISMTMSPRGTLSDVVLPPKLLEALAKVPNLPGVSEMVSKEGLGQLMKQSSLEFPEGPIKEGDTWQSKIEMKNPIIGAQVVTTTYTYEGPAKEDGKDLERVGIAIAMVFNSTNPAVKLNVKDQQSEGHLLFDNAAGNLHSSQSKLKMALEISAGGNMIVQNITTDVNLTVQPAAAQPAP